MRVLDTRQMRAADRAAIDEVGIPSIVLMENAGHRVVEAMETVFDDLTSRRVAVLCGRGSNGGDGFVVARRLCEQGTNVGVFLFGVADDVRGDARAKLEALDSVGVVVVEVPDEDAWMRCREKALERAVIVDALFGTGLSRPLAGMWERVVADVNDAAVPVVSVDLPSGLSADHHEPIGPAVAASVTVTLTAPKLPLLIAPAATYAGELVVADIGIPGDVVDALDGQYLDVVTPEAVSTWLPEREADAHKGSFGHVLIVGGSVGKTGAACLAGRGALRSGAGLVTVATPRSCVTTVALGAPEYMTLPLPETADGAVAAEALEAVLASPCDVIAIGPGLGTGSGAVALVEGLLAGARVPLVLDADALNICASRFDRIQARDDLELVLTPHPGEMARLCDTSTAEVQNDRVAAARRVASEHRAYVVLKGARSLVATPDGRVSINLTGNPGMASGGTGDVLTGVTAAWVGQLDSTGDACRVAVHLHGLAGDIAAETHSEVAMTASDLIRALGEAVQAVQSVKETINSESERSGDDPDRS